MLVAAKTAMLLLALTHMAPVAFGAGDGRWWPTQALPMTVLRSTNQQRFSEHRLALQMMLQSVAGLAARAVNEGRGDEMVWVDNGEGDLEKWYARLIARHPEFASPGALEPWELVDRFAKRGIIKGYLLYHSDKFAKESQSESAGADGSVNVATSLAGILDGVIVSEELEMQAKAHGLKLLMDVRDKSPAWCFQTYQNQFNRRMLCLQSPRRPHARDLAIAQRAFTAYGSADPVPRAMAWLEPLSPILGWGGGDEFEATELSTGFGHIQTATDWCLNLPVLMAGTEKLEFPKTKGFDPRTIDWKDSRSGVTFVNTDGDNVQVLEGNFAGNASYWGNPARGKIPFGWSCCFDHLSQLCPQAMEYLTETRTKNDGFIEWGGGYYYPDHFARGRTNRWELLAQHSRRTWDLMQKTGTRIIGFNFTQLDSPETHRACEVFAGQTDGLLAVLAFQYSAYEAGAGKTIWVKDRNGIDVPVITARYSIWEHANRARAGTPAKVAREITQTIAATPPAQLPRYDWAMAHMWSYFKLAPGPDENMPQDNAEARSGVRGYSPVLWCAERLPSSIRAMDPEELVWRIRMKHNPAQTRMAIEAFR